MADIANGAQFSDLPSCLAIDILLRLPVKTLLTCRYVRKDWTRLYFSDPYFIRRQLETSSIQFLNKRIKRESKLRFGCFVDEVSTGNLRMETLDFSCKLLQVRPPEYDGWYVANSCNGLLCLRDKYERYDAVTDKLTCVVNSSVYVCNPILGEWVSIPFPNENSSYHPECALGFSANHNQYKILLCISIGDRYPEKYEWKIYTLGTGHWRSIETEETIEPWERYGCPIFIHGSLHWIYDSERARVVQSFDFETERFTVLSLPKNDPDCVNLELGVINGCLWASFLYSDDALIWAMKEYGVDKSWTKMLALLYYDEFEYYDTRDEVLLARNKELVVYDGFISEDNYFFTLNGDELLICDKASGEVICYNIKTMRHREITVPTQDIGHVTAYNPSFVSLHDVVGRGEQVISSSIRI